MIKLFACDVDGTLLNGDEHVSDAVLQAMEKLHANGVTFMFCSGRGYRETADVRRLMSFKASGIYYNGATFADGDGVSQISYFLSSDDVRFIFDLGKKMGLGTFFSCEKHTYGFNHDSYFLPHSLAYYKRKYQCDDEMAAQKREENFCISDLILIDKFEDLPEKVFKIAFYFANDDEVDKVEEIIHQRETLNVHTNRLFNNIEIIVKQTSKGDMLKRVCQEMNIDLDCVATAGDSENDINMLKGFKHSYAMGNSNDLVKQNASNIAPSNDEDGVAYIINEILKENEKC